MRDVLCWFGFHDWSERDRAHFDHLPVSRPLYVRFCARCAYVDGATLTDEQAETIDRAYGTLRKEPRDAEL